MMMKRTFGLAGLVALGAAVGGWAALPLAQPPAQSSDSGDGGPGQDPANPTGRQEPAVSVEWLGPSAAKVGQACDYTILVRNACNIPIQQVLVRVRLAGAASVVATEPKALAEDN